MFNEAEVKSEGALFGVVVTALKVKKLSELLVQKGVITEDELKKMNADTVREATDEYLKSLDD